MPGPVVARQQSARQHDGAGQLVEPVQQIEDELERGEVAPVEVVDRDHGGSRLGGARDQREQPVRHGQVLAPVGFGVAARRCPRASAPGSARARAGAVRCVSGSSTEQRAQQLGREAERQVLLELGPGARAAPAARGDGPRRGSPRAAASCPFPDGRRSAARRRRPRRHRRARAPIAISASSRSSRPILPAHGTAASIRLPQRHDARIMGVKTLGCQPGANAGVERR